MKSLYFLTLSDVGLALLPILLAVGIFIYFKIELKTIFHAIFRMLLQLITIGFCLTYIFQTKNAILISLILLVMLSAASWISLRTIPKHRKHIYLYAVLSLGVAALPILALIVFGIINPKPWYEPTYLIPLAGMVFANSMNALSLGADRFFREYHNNVPYEECRKEALKTAMIPVMNMFFAVGLVSLPGMMTGQILAGISPLIAVRYQILIMSSICGSSAVATAVFLSMLRKRYDRIIS